MQREIHLVKRTKRRHALKHSAAPQSHFQRRHALKHSAFSFRAFYTVVLFLAVEPLLLDWSS